MKEPRRLMSEALPTHVRLCSINLPRHGQRMVVRGEPAGRSEGALTGVICWES